MCGPECNWRAESLGVHWRGQLGSMSQAQGLGSMGLALRRRDRCEQGLEGAGWRRRTRVVPRGVGGGGHVTFLWRSTEFGGSGLGLWPE